MLRTTMDIASKTVTQRVHEATATVDDLKGVAIAAVTHQLGLSSDAIVSATADLQDDGSIKVEVVEAVPDTPKPAAPTTPQTMIPMGIGAPQPVI